MSNGVIVKDPLGEGVQRVIGSRALTESIADERIKVSSEKGNSYIAYLNHNIQTMDVYEPLAHFTNTGAYQIHIQGILLNTNINDIEVELFADSTLTSGGNPIIPRNFNRSSTNEAHTTIIDNSTNDLVCSAGNIEFFHASLDRGKPVYIDLFGSFILGINNTFFLQCLQNGAATAQIRAMVIFYEEVKNTGSHIQGGN